MFLRAVLTNHDFSRTVEKLYIIETKGQGYGKN